MKKILALFLVICFLYIPVTYAADSASDELIEDSDIMDEEDDEEIDGDIYEVECPECHDIIYLDESMLEDEEMICPNCGTRLEFEFECECDGDCDCEE